MALISSPATISNRVLVARRGGYRDLGPWLVEGVPQPS